MKRIFIIVSAMFVALVSCQVQELYEGNLDNEDVFYAQIEEDGSTKTTIDDNNNIRWSSNDQLVIFRKTSLGVKYQIQEEYVGRTSGYFSKVVSGTSSDDFGAGMSIDHNIAYYPYSGDVIFAKSGSDYTLQVELPSEQTYAQESFGNGAFPMAAVSEDRDLTFKNVCGGIKLQFKGVGKVVSVKVEGKSQEKLSGAGTVTVYSNENMPQIAMAEGASTSVMLNCSNGVQLNETESTEFIITLPPVSFDNGFVITVTDPQGNEEIVQTDRKNEVSRSTLLVMPEVTLVDIEPEDTSVDLSANGTANSYIVSESGEYRFKPTQGNSLVNVGEIASAEVLWESFGTDVAPTVGDLIANVRLSGKYIKFETAEAFREGNALIAAKDASGTVLWSWHIWMTDQPEEHIYSNNAGVLMDRNLGATNTTPGDIGSHGLLYQWGRKDPFMGASSTYFSIDDPEMRAASTAEWSYYKSNSSTGTIEYATKNPTRFIYGDSNTYDDWMYSTASPYNIRWASEKTIYDPCPAGWRVPDGGTIGDDGFWAVAGVNEVTYDVANYGAIYNVENASGAWYPLTGYIGVQNRLLGVGSVGSYWSANVASFDAYVLAVYNSAISPDSREDRFYGRSVRCFKEGSADVPVVPSPGVPKEGDYVDEDGVNHGQGIQIDGIVWAPVNVGASAQHKYGDYYSWIGAHTACPEGWRLPYASELRSLAVNSQVDVLNGVNGRWYSGSKTTINPTSAIFLPAAGDENGHIQKDTYGRYASLSGAGTLYSCNTYMSLEFDLNDNSSVGTDSGSNKISVRCVRVLPEEVSSSSKTIDGLTWATKNMGAYTETENGNRYKESTSIHVCPEGWRLPNFDDMRALGQNHSDLVTVNGVEGRWLSGSNVISNSSTGIFFPLAGYEYMSNDGTRFKDSPAIYFLDSKFKLSFDDQDFGLSLLSYSELATPVRCVKGVYTGPEIESAHGTNDTSVEIDGLTWASKNLGAETIDGYGDRFTWNDALNACPEGWRLPTSDEMTSLITSWSWDYVSGVHGILCTGRTPSKDSNSAVFFPAVSAGLTNGYYWTSSEKVLAGKTYPVALSMNSSLSVGSRIATNLSAVRCVQGELAPVVTASYTLQLSPSSTSSSVYGWQKSSSVSNPDTNKYDGVYESLNVGKDNSQSYMYIDIVGYETFKIYVRSDAESQYDYLVVSDLDSDINANSTNVKFTTSNMQNSKTDISAYTLVEFNNIDKGEHRITIMFKKDTSVSNGKDSGYVLIPKNQ